MAWRQVKQPNLNITYTGGWCLAACRTAFGIAAKYPTATADWNAGPKRSGKPPAGLYVPVYFSLGKVAAGHIAIAMPDGRVASSTQNGPHQGLYIHPNLADLVALYARYNGGCTYLGWSDAINDTPVVRWIGTDADKEAANDVNYTDLTKDLYQVLGGKQPEQWLIDQKAAYMRDANSARQVIKDLLEAYAWRSNEQANLWALSNYDAARGGKKPDQFARERLAGGDDYPKVIRRDLPAYIEGAKRGDELAKQVSIIRSEAATNAFREAWRARAGDYPSKATVDDWQHSDGDIAAFVTAHAVSQTEKSLQRQLEQATAAIRSLNEQKSELENKLVNCQDSKTPELPDGEPPAPAKPIQDDAALVVSKPLLLRILTSLMEILGGKK